jgi:hypothetical protein
MQSLAAAPSDGLQLLGNDSGHQEELKHQLVYVRAELMETPTEPAIAQAEVVKAMTDGAAAESACQMAVEALDSVWWDLGQGWSEVRAIKVHAMRDASAVAIIAGSHRL